MIPSTSTSPLLDPPTPDPTSPSLRQQSLREASRFLRRSTGRRMTNPSMLVRETAAEELEERQSDWAYSRPVVVLDLLWNFVFIIVGFVVLGLSREEKPDTPLRVWVVGYALQCGVHMVCVCFEYRRRVRRREGEEEVEGLRGDGEVARYVTLARLTERVPSSVVKNLESANTMFSFVWWIIGFYWVSPDGQALIEQSPQLYWLCIIFLAFDVFFVVFCVALACVIGIAVCCCLPCIIAVLYAVVDQEGATREDIEKLLKYKFRRLASTEKPNGEIQGPSGGVMTECGTDSPTERILAAEDLDCCICLAAYDDGAELRELPCGHHFHCTCIDKWLHINATCPLCKYDILKQSHNGIEEV
ncbi:Zinc finger, C3HC4 type [Heracleum sosnowskyi]|uniref:RING-type E3 ubiquitin transferase n=1 Tax=Heracleum sosnowskyi TaxID=360622 RepID=A0AAD8LYI8_9APIA|nr:Zinc finger, C3HC4 type [Heracleum sosnowskyi]